EPCSWTPGKGQEGGRNPATSPQLPQQQPAGGEVYGDPPAAAVFLGPGLYVPRPPVRRNQRVPPGTTGRALSVLLQGLVKVRARTSVESVRPSSRVIRAKACRDTSNKP
ncbi:hypothetical protein GOODEAATRI_032016, partial [Goodea atripinnis]